MRRGMSLPAALPARNRARAGAFLTALPAPGAGGRRGPGARRIAAAAVLATLAGAPAATAAPPANDAPGAAVEVNYLSAETGRVDERQGVADLRAATADAGVPRCLGKGSFERTVWFRIPAAQSPMRLRLTAVGPSEGPDATPDLAAFVSQREPGKPNTTLPQACDGAAAKPPGDTGSDGSAGAVLDVPERRAVLVQVGAPAGSPLEQAVLSVGATQIAARPAPVGDRASAAKSYPLGRARLVPLIGAQLTEEDPATPACPAAGTVWRKLLIRQSGLQVAATSGSDVASLTVFLGRRPSLTTGVACGSGTSELLEVPFRARRGQRAWVRVGTTVPDAATSRLAVSGPCQQTPLRPLRRSTVRIARGGKRRSVRLSLRGPCVKGVRLVVRQRGKVVARARVGRLVRGDKTVPLRARAGARLRAGRARVTVTRGKGRRLARATVRLR